MASFNKTKTPTSARYTPASAIFRSFASLKLAVILISVLAVVLAGATIMEAAKGRDYTQWYVYKSTWFIGLLTLLAINILAATLIRFPWKKRQIGFLITHAGLLVLLAGSIQTFVAGIEGQMSFAEGDSANMILIADRSRMTASWHEQDTQISLDFAFRPGPVDWREGKTKDLGRSDEVAIKVLKFYRHARSETSWARDDSKLGGPALKFVLNGPGGRTLTEEWLSLDSGGQTSVGPLKFELHAALVDSMLEDFTNPPGNAMGEQGVLSIHYEGQMTRVPVHEKLGTKITLGESKVSVEIVEYLANARPGGSGKFVSAGDQPQNPFLELLVHLPDRKQPARQIALAMFPMLNLDVIHGRSLPVKFYYHHPAVPVASGAKFLQMPDGKLHCRIGADNLYKPQGEVEEGDRIEVAAGFELAILQHLPHAREEVTFRPVELAPGETAGPEAAALVEATAWGSQHEIWLKRNDRKHGFQTISTSRGPLLVEFAYVHLPLDFSLKLLDFKRGLNPGRMGNASFASSVQLLDQARAIDEKREISMNEPLTHGKFTFYQSSFQELPDGREISFLSVAYDPGRFLKYLGSLMICVGIFLMFYRRINFSAKVPST